MFKKLKLKLRDVIREESEKGAQAALQAGKNDPDYYRQLVQDALKTNSETAALQSKIGAVEQRRDIMDAPIATNTAAVKKMDAALKKGDADAALALVKKLAANKRKSNESYLAAASELRTMIRRRKEDETYKESLKTLFDLHTLDEFSNEQFADVFNLRFPIFQASSMSSNLTRRRRMRQIGNVPEKWLIYSKEAGNLFAQMVGAKLPETTVGVKYRQIEPRTDIAIKPRVGRGARGVYLVRELDDILCLTNGSTVLHSWDEMLASIENELESGTIGEDDFIVQQCIYNEPDTKDPPRDLKFHIFYGELGAVFEVSRYPDKHDWWWDEKGRLMDTGWHWTGKEVTGKNTETLRGYGFTQEQLEQARKISLAVPCPYLRIDFMRCGTEAYFTEFCTYQGNMTSLNTRTNQLFGNLYLKAEMRIVNDMLEGKKFDELNEFNRICEERYGKH